MCKRLKEIELNDTKAAKRDIKRGILFLDWLPKLTL